VSLATSVRSSKALWYLTRATGVVTLLLLTTSVGLGILQVTRWQSPRWPRFVTAGLHKNVSLLVVAFLVVHVATAVIDPFAPIRWLDAVLPFTAAYRPVWLGFGAVACDLLIALVVTSLLRTRLGYERWRAVHWFAYACWPVALIHGLGTGSDTHHAWALGLEAASVAVVAGATWWRIGQSVSVSTARRALAAAGVGAAVVATATWAFVGPLQPAWARRAGTPTRLLPSARVLTPTTTSPAATGSSTTTAPVAALRIPFSAQITGTVHETGPDANGDTTVVVDAFLHGTATGRVHVVIQGPAAPGGGVSMDRSRAYLGTLAQPALYAGSVVRLAGPRVSARVTDASGRHIELVLDLSIDPSGVRVTGRARARVTEGANG
jgi:sulfoxide reductase heme-binding subunit YedZ